jgi:hypothetical protein
MSDDHKHIPTVRARLAAAAVTGLLAGIARAVTSWFLDHTFTG